MQRLSGHWRQPLNKLSLSCYNLGPDWKKKLLINLVLTFKIKEVPLMSTCVSAREVGPPASSRVKSSNSLKTEPEVLRATAC